MLALDQVREKSAARLVGLQPVVAAGVKALIQRSYTRGVPIVITQGLRTIAEQNSGDKDKTADRQEVVQEASGSDSNGEGDKQVNKDVKVTITLNGSELTEGVIDNGITYVPLRALAEALGATVTYDSESKTVNVEKE